MKHIALKNKIFSTLTESRSNKTESNLLVDELKKESSDFSIAYESKIQKGNCEGLATISIQLDNWRKENYVFMPASVYAGNRFPVIEGTKEYHLRPLVFPPLNTNPHELQITEQVACLNFNEGTSRLERVASDSGTPGMGLWFPEEAAGFFVYTPQKFSSDEIAFSIEENEARDRAIMEIKGVCSKESDVFSFVIEFYDAPSLGDYFEHFFASRKKYYRKTVRKEAIPFSACWEIIENKFNESNWVSDGPFYSNVLSNPRWSSGWTGGLINTLPLIQEGCSLSLERSLKTWGFVFPAGQGDSGFLYSNAGVNDWKTDRSDAENQNAHLVRKSGDVLFFGLRQLFLMRDRNISIPEEWTDCIRNLADAFVKLWKQYGQFGQKVDMQSGRLLIPNSTSAAIVPAGLILAAKYFEDRTYTDVAISALHRFIDVDLNIGVTSGGPGDAYQCPDSESAFALVESFALALEETKDAKILKHAKYAISMASSWTLSYDVEFPDTSTFGLLDMKTTGSVFANAQNRHDAPAICTLSGEGLLRSYRLLRDPLIMDLLCDIAHGIPQYISRDDRPIRRTISVDSEMSPYQPAGWISERVNVTPNWCEPIGETFAHTSWAEVSMMLTWSDLPGVYLDMEHERIWILDNISGELKDGKLILHNPTAFPASVKILIEDGYSLKKTIKTNFGSMLPRIDLLPRDTVTLDPAEYLRKSSRVY